MNTRRTIIGSLLAIALTPVMPTRFALPPHTVNQQQACVAPPAGLVSWWPGDGTGEDVWSGHNGMLKNGITFADGVVDQAFKLDGSNDSSYVGYDDDFNFASAGQWSIEAWSQPQPDGTMGAMVVKSPADGQWDWGLYLEDTNHFMAGRASHNILHSMTLVQAGVWYHVVATYDNGTWKMYVNGVLESTVSGTTVTQSAGALAIGVRGESGFDPYGGLIDEASLYNRALTASEISQLYQAGSEGKWQPPQTMAVSGITPDYRPMGELYRVAAQIGVNSVFSGAPLSGAVVDLSVTMPDSTVLLASPTTDALGHATVSFVTSLTGTLIFTVRDVQEDGWTYDPSHNVETTDQLTVPYAMHVSSVEPGFEQQGGDYTVWADVQMQDQGQKGVANAQVEVMITLPGGGSVEQRKRTNATGLARFSLRTVTTGTYTFTEVDASKSHWTYDPSQNNETSDSITIS